MDVIPFKKENLENFLNLYCEITNKNNVLIQKVNLKSKSFDVENIILIFIFSVVLGVKLFMLYYKNKPSKKAKTSTMAISSSLV
jgi:hypothetical protein